MRISATPFPRSFLLVVPVEPIRWAIYAGQRRDMAPEISPVETMDLQFFVEWPWAEDEGESLQWFCDHIEELRMQARRMMITPGNLN